MPIMLNGLSGGSVPRTGDGAPIASKRNEGTSTRAENADLASRDTAYFTDRASRLQSVENTLDALPVVNPTRVEAVQKAKGNGTYTINNREVAGKLLEFEQLLETSLG